MNNKCLYIFLILLFGGCKSNSSNQKETEKIKETPIIKLEESDFKHDFFYHHNKMRKAIKTGNTDEFLKSSRWFSTSPDPDIVFGFAFQMAIRYPNSKTYKMLFNSMRNFPIKNQKNRELIINYALYFLAKSYELNKEHNFKIRFEGMVISNETIQESEYYLKNISNLDDTL